MFKSLLVFAAISAAPMAYANELDQNVVNQGLQGTVIIRVDQRTQKAAVATSTERTANAESAQQLVASAEFKALPASKVKNELDQEAGASSWYWYYNYNYGYNYNYLYWYGYSYRPYYNYNYGYYSYYYYNRWGFGW